MGVPVRRQKGTATMSPDRKEIGIVVTTIHQQFAL